MLKKMLFLLGIVGMGSFSLSCEKTSAYLSTEVLLLQKKVQKYSAEIALSENEKDKIDYVKKICDTQSEMINIYADVIRNHQDEINQYESQYIINSIRVLKADNEVGKSYLENNSLI